MEGGGDLPESIKKTDGSTGSEENPRQCSTYISLGSAQLPVLMIPMLLERFLG